MTGADLVLAAILLTTAPGTPEPCPPAAQRLISVAMRVPTGSLINGPKACRRAGLPSAWMTASGRASGDLRGTIRTRGRPEKELSSGARR